MKDYKPHIFKFKWWAVLYCCLVELAFGLPLPLAHRFFLQFPEWAVISYLVIGGAIAFFPMLYWCWEPWDENIKTWKTFNQEFKFSHRFNMIAVTMLILTAWLGVGICLIMLPHWIGDSLNSIAGGLIQFAGMCWIVIWLSAIMNIKK